MNQIRGIRKITEKEKKTRWNAQKIMLMLMLKKKIEIEILWLLSRLLFSKKKLSAFPFYFSIKHCEEIQKNKNLKEELVRCQAAANEHTFTVAFQCQGSWYELQLIYAVVCIYYTIFTNH